MTFLTLDDLDCFHRIEAIYEGESVNPVHKRVTTEIAINLRTIMGKKIIIIYRLLLFDVRFFKSSRIIFISIINFYKR